MNVIVAAVVGFLAGRMLWLALRKSWNQPELMRTNYNGTTVPTAAGIVLLFTLLLIEGGRAVAAGLGVGDGEGLTPERLAVVVVVAGFSLLGLLDDLVGSSATRGLAGHLQAMAKGSLTTGGLKLVGGVLTALVCAAIVSDGGVASLIVGAGVIALAANLANLFDLRPGRASKIGLLAMLALTIAGWSDIGLVPVAVVAGATASMLLDDLRERLMLGDTGANALGATLGLGLVMTTDFTTQLISLGVLASLNLLSEFVSFTKIFDQVAPLRAFDNLGRRPSSTLDLREPGEPEDPFEEGSSPSSGDTGQFRERISTTTASLRGTVEDVHAGKPAGSHSMRERSPFAPEPSEPESSDPFDGPEPRSDADFFSSRRPTS